MLKEIGEGLSIGVSITVQVATVSAYNMNGTKHCTAWVGSKVSDVIYSLGFVILELEVAFHVNEVLASSTRRPLARPERHPHRTTRTR